MAPNNRFIPLFSSQSGAVPTASAMEEGELAINITDGRLFTRRGNDIIILAGHTQVSASYANTASWVPNLYPAGAIPILYEGELFIADPLALEFNGPAVSIANIGNTASITIISGATDWSTITSKPTGIVSSSDQTNTGSFSGSFVGNFIGSASYATTASAATSITFTPTTSSYAITASAATSLTFTPTTASYSSTASYALNAGITNFSTGSYTGSFTGSLQGSASYATTASAATSITFVPATASYASTDWSVINNKPVVVSGSQQINTGSFTGSFRGELISFGGGNINTNFAIGTNTLTNNTLGGLNVAIGDSALYSSVAGIGNVAIGYQASNANISGSYNVAIGQLALSLNKDGISNVAIGATALRNTVVSSNVGIGTSTLYQNISGTYNVAIGDSALSFNTASYNTAIGNLAQYFNRGGTDNISIGYQSLYSNESGSTNLAIGNYALNFIQAGNGNVAIGHHAGHYETGSDTFYVNNRDRFSISLDQTDSLLYGKFAATPVAQMLRINAQVSMSQNVLAMQGITGSLQGSASYALTASYALNGGGSTNFSTGSYTGSFTGNLVGSASYSTTSSAATSITFVPATASYATYAVTASYISSSVDFPNGLVITGSTVSTLGFTGSLQGSASYALTASYALNGGTGGVSSSYALTASYARTGSYALVAQNVLGSITSASWAATASYLLGSIQSASWAQNAATASYISSSVDFPEGLIVTGSTISTLGFTGSLQGSSSYALTSSYALNGGGSGVSASYALTSSYARTGSYALVAQNVLGSITSASWAATASYLFGSIQSASWASYAVTASYISSSVNFPEGLTVTGSTISTLGFTGSLQGSASYALTASYAMNGGGGGVSASYATMAATASYMTGSINFTNGLSVTGSTVSTLGFTGSLQGSASYALTASYAANGGGSGVSSSYALTASYARTGSYALVAQNVLGSITSASYATYAVTASYISSSVDFPNGLIITGSTVSTLGFTGSLQGSASYALTASYAMNGGGGGVSASYATMAATASYVSGGINFNNGLVVTGSLIVTNGITGSWSGSIASAVSSSYALTASYALNGGGGGVSASYATTASYSTTAVTSSYTITAATASYFSGTLTFPTGLDVTGSFITTGDVIILQSASLSPAATVKINPIGVAAVTATLPFTKLFVTASTDSTVQIPSGTTTGSIFEMVYSNVSAGTRTVTFPDARMKDGSTTSAIWSSAQSSSLFFQFRYLPVQVGTTSRMTWMPMFTQSIS